MSPAYAMSFKSFICSAGGGDLSFLEGIEEQDRRGIPGSSSAQLPFVGRRNFETGKNFGSFNFVKGSEELDGRGIPGSSVQFPSPGERNFETGRNLRTIDFFRRIVEQDGKGIPGSAQPSKYTVERHPDIVHIKLLRNNAFVTLTDFKGNKKIGTSAGALAEMKGGPKVSRYSADATAEHVGRLARNISLKSVIVKVNGFIHFKKKRQAILCLKEGFGSSKGDESLIRCVEDTTRRPHNGCRLRKERRVKKRTKSRR